MQTLRYHETLTDTVLVGSRSLSPAVDVTTIYRVIVTQDTHFRRNAAATTSDMLVKANVETFMVVDPGDSIHYIQASADGVIYATRATRF